MNKKLRKSLKSKVTAYYQLQGIRKTIGNILWMFENSEEWRKKRKLPPMQLEANEKALLTTVYGDIKTGWEGIQKKEKTLKKEIEKIGKETKIWANWLKDVKGIGPFMAGIIEAKLVNRTFPSRSHLTRYVGYSTENGKAISKVKGQSLNYNPTLRSFFWNVGKSLVKANGVYYQEYLRYKKIYTARYPNYVTPKGGWGKLPKNKQHPGHLDKIARMRMVKLFLSHLWEEMFKIQNPKKRVPMPMHFPNAPLKPSEYIPPLRDS